MGIFGKAFNALLARGKGINAIPLAREVHKVALVALEVLRNHHFLSDHERDVLKKRIDNQLSKELK